MRAIRSAAILIGLVIVPAGFAAQRAPKPTEVASGHDEASLVREREAWLESLHRAGPGIDWRRIERDNWGRLLTMRMTASLAPLNVAWTEVGSLNLAGRTHQSVYDPASGKLFLGTSLGGVWRGDFDPSAPNPASMNWAPLSDNAYGGARGLVVFPGPSLTILKTQYGYFSGEIHRTTNGGTTWSVVASLNGQLKRMLKLTGSATTGFVLVSDCCSPHSELYRTTDAGASFQLLRTFAGYEADIWTPRTSAGSLYLLTGNHIEVSANRGMSWSVRGTLPFPTATRATLAGSEAGAPRLYAVAMTSDESSRRLLRSDDAGVTWVDKGAVTDFWGDHVSLAASTLNPDLVLYGGLECRRSIDGGESFQSINSWGDYYSQPATRLHADIPSIDFTPSSGGGEALFIGTDGGTYFSGDGGATVTNLSLQGLRISQYYSTLSDATDPQLVEGGSQDQGYQIGNAGTGQFNQIFSGDYSQLTSSDGTSQVVFSVYPAFVLAVENLGAGNFRINTRDFPAGEEHFWMAPLAADPRNRNVVYLGARRLYRYELTGINTWSVTQLPFNFQSQAGEYVSAIAIAPSDPNRWYVATNQGRLYFSSDAGTNWTPSTFTSVPAPQYLTGLALAVHPTSPEVVAVGGSGYGNPGVYLSQNGGVSFSALGAGQPQTLVTDLAWGPSPAGDLYAATESGPWRHLTTSGTWESLLQNTAPMTTYWSVERAGSRMRFGTYGRGAWDFETCIGIVAPTVAPSLTLGKESASSRLDWTSSGSGMHYDVVRGSLNGLRSSFGNFTSATQACVADDLAAATVLDSSSPSPGAGSWYLVRAVNCAGTGTYDSGAATQQGSRDAEIAASTSTCP